MKTQNDIMTILYEVIKASPIDALTGGVYKKIRPTDSILEDCVIGIISGTNAKFVQDGAILIKLFYNDLNENNTFFEDTKRGGELETLLSNLSEVLLKNNLGISFYIQSRQLYSEKFEEKQQHYVILKMNFKIAY